MNKEKLTIVKIGGNVIDDEKTLTVFLADFKQIAGAKILVHGGGKMATKLAERLGIVSQMHQGRRITDATNLQLATMVYAGWINKNIVAKLQGIDVNAIGLSGADANAVATVKRPAQPIDFGFVGDVQTKLVNLPLLNTLLQQNFTPVFCSITHDQHGSLLNTNADSVAFVLAAALVVDYQVNLIYCFEKNGVLLNANDDSTMLSSLSFDKMTELKRQEIIHSGMLPKLDNAFSALQAGVNTVQIKHAKNLLNSTGTEIVL